MKFKEQSNMLTWETMQGRIKPLAVLLLLLCGAVPALAGTIYVNSTNDGIGAGCPSANCTLRDALLKAATTGDVIELQAGATYKATYAVLSQTAYPQINAKISINGRGAVIERDAAAPLFRFFEVAGGGELTLESLTLRNGKTSFWGGGAIVSSGRLTLVNCIFENNAVDGVQGSWSGGAVLNRFGTVKIEGCSFRNNSAPNGGALGSDGDAYDPPNPALVANLEISNSSFTNNRAIRFYNASLNTYYGAFGGGLFIRSAHKAKLTSLTIAANRADEVGGGIAFHTLHKFDAAGNALSTVARNLTIVQNRAMQQGGGLYYTVCGANCPLANEPDFANSIVTGNIAPSAKDYAAHGSFKSSGHNIIGQGIGTFPAFNDQLLSSMPNLNGLSSNGQAGGDSYHPNSPSAAIDTGDPALCPATDQLGFGRVGVCDIGAVEYRSCVAPPSGMSAWWAFDSYYTLEDIATWSFLNHAAPVTSDPLQVPGMVGGAVQFANAGQVLEVPSQSDINLYNSCAVDGGAAFSIDAWVKTGSAGLQVILDKRQFSGSSIKGYHLFVYDGRLGFQLADGANYSNFLTPLPSSVGVDLSDNQWHLVAVTVYVRCQRNGSAFEGKMYIDGKMVQTFTPGGGDYSNNAPLRIGGHSSASSLYFEGSLDEIEIFQRTLSAAEIQSLYNAGWAGKCGKKIPPGCNNPNDPNRSCY
ncbi:MAG TPA: LamG domain-containing protein [Blastocatellia bacterium]|nr:LamG domain-containing protein [Blastocatellia bacterium]HMV87141.1 LamG domain-containing protein [Blastocatellia bacterium]HMX27868.1 LamG domain-containing protein [Blastocatellia bacterium]HMZ19792.1 LamG domain-containing protein [Blastocatellia bacterium]HNG31017.1 LamG domain-containing protein [Blastocatellia bacterium]